MELSLTPCRVTLERSTPKRQRNPQLKPCSVRLERIPGNPQTESSLLEMNTANPADLQTKSVNPQTDDTHAPIDPPNNPPKKRVNPKTRLLYPQAANAVPSTPESQRGLSSELHRAIREKNILTARSRSRVLLALCELKDNNIEEEQKRQREEAASEILTSESAYLRQLELIRNYFMGPAKEQNVLATDDFEALFGGIDVIFNVNAELYRELKENSEDVAGAFSKLAPYFKLYSVYAYDYRKSLNILQKAQTQNKLFSAFLDKQESRPEVQMKLSALLITPIQRVPRYRLLLKQVLDNTPPTHDQYSSLIDSLKKVEVAAQHINTLVEEQENTQRLLELQRSLINGYPSIIRPSRKLIKDGVLMKMSRSGTKSYKRYFVLCNDILMYCKLKKENPQLANSLKCSCILPLNKCRVNEMLSKGVIKISCEGETLVVYHERGHESEEWARVLKEAVKDYVSNRMTLRKDSSARRPVHKKYISEYQELGISPGKPRLKRRNNGNEKDLDTIFKASSNDSEDSDTDPRCFSIGLTKRKRIKRKSPEQKHPPKLAKIAESTKDSLFPLRELKDKIPEQNVHDDTDALNNQLAKTNEVFVFGANNENKGFRFGMGNIFSGLGNTVRRMFGFKNP